MRKLLSGVFVIGLSLICIALLLSLFKMRIADDFEIAGAIFLLLFFTLAIAEIMLSKGISFREKMAKAFIYILIPIVIGAHMLKGLIVPFLIIYLGYRYLEITRRQLQA